MSAGGTSGVTQLEFHQAMNDFKNMFPEMAEDVIEAVLRANNGVVDATIDQLLQMNNESLKKKAAMAAHKKENLYNQSNLYSVEGSNAKDGKSYKKNLQFMNDKISKDSLRYKNRWDPPLLGELSPTFLRISLNETQRKLTNLDTNKTDAHLISSSFLQQKMEENERNRQITSLNDDPELAQFLEDERFAILMQNEEFVRELRLNRDFMSTLESDNYIASGANVGDGAAGTSNNFAESDAMFKEKLRNMGKVSKKKFTQLARLFSGRTKKSFKQLDESTSRDRYLYEDLNDSLRDVNSADSSREARKANIKF